MKNDPFLAKHLNPLFLQTVQSYWNLLDATPEADQQEVLKAQRNLARFIFRRLFQPLYLHAAPRLAGKVYFLSSIHSDGIGDYFALLKSARVFAQKHPEMEVHAAYRHQLPLPPVDPADYLLKAEHIHDFHEVTDYNIIEGVLKGDDVLPFEQKLEELENERQQLQLDIKSAKKQGGAAKAFEELMQECEQKIKHFTDLKKLKAQANRFYKEITDARALVHIALAINTFDNPVLAPKSLYFAEAGNFQGIADLLQRNWFSMGLHPFEEGIFLRKSFLKNDSWKDKRLGELLCGTAHPRCLHLAYLTRIPVLQIIFLYLIAAYHKDDARDIDVVLPKIQKKEIERMNRAWLKCQGIGKVTLVDFDDDGKEKILFKVDAKGKKTLRLIHAFPLPAADFEKILELSDELVGCTGAFRSLIV